MDEQNTGAAPEMEQENEEMAPEETTSAPEQKENEGGDTGEAA